MFSIRAKELYVSSNQRHPHSHQLTSPPNPDGSLIRRPLNCLHCATLPRFLVECIANSAENASQISELEISFP